MLKKRGFEPDVLPVNTAVEFYRLTQTCSVFVLCSPEVVHATLVNPEPSPWCATHAVPWSDIYGSPPAPTGLRMSCLGPGLFWDLLFSSPPSSPSFLKDLLNSPGFLGCLFFSHCFGSPSFLANPSAPHRAPQGQDVPDSDSPHHQHNH
jgi:hypothetical protein